MVDDEQERLGALRELLWTGLHDAVPGLVRLTPRRDALPNTLMVAVPGVLGSEVLDRVDTITASTGSACHAGSHTPSATLTAMGVAPEVSMGALRLSMGRSTTAEEVTAATRALAAACR